MLQPLDGRFKSVTKKTIEFCDKKRRRMANRQQVTEYHAAEDQDEAQDGATPRQLRRPYWRADLLVSISPRGTAKCQPLGSSQSCNRRERPGRLQCRVSSARSPTGANNKSRWTFQKDSNCFPSTSSRLRLRTVTTGTRLPSASTKLHRRPKYQSQSQSHTGPRASRRSEHATLNLSPVSRSATRTLTEP